MGHSLDSIGWKDYLVFIVVLLSYGATVCFYYPETKGYTLEAIAVVFDGKQSDSYVEADLKSPATD